MCDEILFGWYLLSRTFVSKAMGLVTKTEDQIPRANSTNGGKFWPTEWHAENVLQPYCLMICDIRKSSLTP